ncbi:hypothetical protein AB9P05_01295 [Roseivirga sp. BDSF3-8]|uniref:hypothetical protein n=1 Tax=Roseivirga sp. BDSF3-8 TaxID=3241598 RepID=UPI003531F877
MSMKEDDLSYLPLFITEPVYLFDEEEPVTSVSSAAETTPGEVAENPAKRERVPEEPSADNNGVREPEQPAYAAGEPEKKEPAPAPVPPKPLPFQGKNEKSIVLAIDTPTNQDQRDLLKKIMASVNITGRDVAMTDVRGLQDPASLPPHRLLISFGVEDPLLFHGEVPVPYEIKKVDHQSFVLADSLSTLYSDISAKKNLWEVLKKLFVA